MNTNLRTTASIGMTLAAVAAMAQAIPVTVNGTPVSFQGQQPVMRGSRVLVPLRGVLEQTGAYVGWHANTKTVWAQKGGTNVKLRIGSRSASINGQRVRLDQPALIVNGSTMVPLRFLGEALGETVKWNDQNNTVQVLSNGDSNTMAQNSNSGQNQNQRPIRISSSPLNYSTGTVIRVGLDTPLDSTANNAGDRFTTTVIGAGLPSDTKIEGVVVGVRPQAGEAPALIEIKFDRIDLPDGKNYPISGALIGLDALNVQTRGSRLAATRNAPTRVAFTGYGSGTAHIMRLTATGRVEDTPIGDLLNLRERNTEVQDTPHDVKVAPGTMLGVRLTSPLNLQAADIH